MRKLNSHFSLDKKGIKDYNYINLVNCEEDGSKIKVTSRDNQPWLKANFSKRI